MIKAESNLKAFSSHLISIVQENTMQAARGEKQYFYPAVTPINHNDQHGKILVKMQ